MTIEDASRGPGRREFARRIRRRCEIELRRKRGVERIDETRLRPLRGKVGWTRSSREIFHARRGIERGARCFRCHALMIQFATSPTKRAAAAFAPPWYRTATTVARAS